MWRTNGTQKEIPPRYRTIIILIVTQGLWIYVGWQIRNLQLSCNLEFQETPFNDEIMFRPENFIETQTIRKCGDVTCKEGCCEGKNCCKHSETNIKQNEY